MQLTVAIYRQSGEQFLSLEVGGDMTLADLKGLIEAESEIPSSLIDVFVRNTLAADNTRTLSSSGLSDGDIIEVRVRRSGQSARPSQQPSTSTSTTPAPASRPRQQLDVPSQARSAAERLRLQALNDPRFLRQMQQQAPDLAASVQDANAFADQYVSLAQRQQEAEAERQQMYARLEDDPFDVEAQAKIEEIIREQQVMKNYEDAVENLPESFAQVTMLYIPVEVNGTPLKAFVDSGAQTTIMSPSCAERCGILRLLDKRFGGIARGVGTAKILGRVHSAQMKVGSVHLACSFTVMEGKDVDLLFGLDMLKRHQGIIDLEKNSLDIQGESISFLPESEIPKKDWAAEEPLVDGPAGLKTGARTGTVVPPEQQSAGAAAGAAAAARASAQPPASTPVPAQSRPQQAAASSQGFPREHIEQLVQLGFSELDAVRALEIAGGSVEHAAGLLLEGSFS